ncbi:AAA family ATPase [Candidatus Woesearchaeota archaeon]|jgi:CMP/dCMP kinase|nr:AAA family ATPase [Candidatus Woesearchaeota archaeon]
MIITLSGNVASGKSTVGKALAEKLKLKHYSTGDFMRKIAKEQKVSLYELAEEAEKSNKIDRLIDEKTIKLSKTKDNFLIDSRLAWYFIPSAVKIYLYAGPKVQIKRLKLDKKLNRRKEEDLKDEKDMMEKIKLREDSERKRYMKYYGIDYHEKRFYDYWLNTDKYSIEECADKILEYIKKKKLLN